MLFNEVIGQEGVKTKLINEVRTGKISHAQLFLGKAGFNTLPLALAFVTYVFCENKGESDSCGVCPSCQKMKTYQHPDLHFSYPVVLALHKTSTMALAEWRQMLVETPLFNLNDWIRFVDPKERKPVIGTEESAEIIKKLSLKSYEGGYKIMIIWMPEEMNQTCANKLLKILEEPPAKTLFLLVSESQERMLPTILSRTQLIKIPPYDIDISRRVLMHLGADDLTATSIASRCDGNLRDAIQQFQGGEENERLHELFVRLMRVCYSKDVNAMLDWTDDIAKLSAEGQKLFINYALHMIRQSVLRNYTNDVLLRVSDKEKAFLVKFSQFITNNNLIDFSEIFTKAHYYIERNAHSKLLFTQLCFQVMRFIHKA